MVVVKGPVVRFSGLCFDFDHIRFGVLLHLFKYLTSVESHQCRNSLCGPTEQGNGLTGLLVVFGFFFVLFLSVRCGGGYLKGNELYVDDQGYE